MEKTQFTLNTPQPPEVAPSPPPPPQGKTLSELVEAAFEHDTIEEEGALISPLIIDGQVILEGAD